ncbi:sulfurtransferase [Haloquadratum walsbyi]|jgi:Rhodanese-related sulfurtransferase|uniref:Rhodanese-related sulfurtransferase n=1 Tax=Haloquadratum walsbyi J07HQW2 TaxID=1238425 RepID=U1NIR4_9EURY|nr:sulfurtransferase [Haloquadratum walsbyi]ERG97115.1 MAG: rhodanese-related sulfurtransferase [Haloquadratum walsbyi J07HQW2]
MFTDSVPTLVDPDWLEDRLDVPDVQILDCTVYLQPGGVKSGYDDWSDAHIPGSQFADLIEDLSETDNPEYPFQLPTSDAFASAVSELGVSNDSRIVLYDTVNEGNNNEWAARLWWMFRVFGHDQVGVLNGGWPRWTAENRPVSSSVKTPQSTDFTAEYRPELVANKEDVRSKTEDSGTCVINALKSDDHAAERIPNSVNVPALGDDGVLDTDGTYASDDALEEQFSEVGATEADDVITYCGAGIAASSEALALHQAGITDVAVYDGSLSEWTADSELPVERDE